MTDSMKFGPEWLRNMSADTTSSNNAGGQTTNSTAIFGTNNSCGGDNTTTNNSNNSNSSSNLSGNSMHNNVNSSSTGASRNTFPEFRYGREEMLLLFDRNCSVPEILPSYKGLFVERVQFPLALVPSTDEEMMPGSAPTAQRPGWLQRSPVGFSTATRGTGRVGCMERGRMRGKSIYHPVFQRPNAMFDEEQRSSAVKVDRSWVERNGGAPGEASISGSTSVSGGGLGADTWNGNTPVSSPRREFSSHPRNMENWRRSRNEEGSGEPSASTAFSADGGWRMNTPAFQNSHTRWGRSTSWRDEDLTNSENTALSGGGTSNAAATGGNVMMVRSNSTISTTHNERVAVSGKPTGPTTIMRSISVASPVTRNSSTGSIWPNNASVGSTSNMQQDGSTNEEMALPEWAMENPSDIGGTFDASGAFHGAVEDDENAANSTEKRENDESDEIVGEDKVPSGTESQDKLSKASDESLTKSTQYQNNSILKEKGYQDSSSPSPSPSSPVMTSHENTDLSEESDKAKQCKNSTKNKPVTSADVIRPENVSPRNSDAHTENDNHNDFGASPGNNVSSYPARVGGSESNTPNCNIGDYAERMMKVTDDMIEKLIMDDEDAKDDHMKSAIMAGGNKINSHNMFMAIQQSQNSNHPSAVSPALVSTSGPSGPPNISLYNMGGMMVDHTHNMAALHQLQQQQMAAVAAVAIGMQPTPPPPHPMTSSAPADLWLYRDPQAKVQGPFSALEMTEWYRAGYFNENLFVRRVCDVRFRPLGELIKICNGQMPFNHSHLIPIDLNPTALTPPLPPVISTQASAQATDFLIKTLNEHQNHQQHEKLKGNVTAAADSLSNALKSLINSVDISQVLNMHFQTLQDRFIQSQEIEIANELSKNECFRRLSPAEQDAVVRQKLQALGLPEYLTNLTGLSNSLAALNPSAGTQLYDTIAECTKKEQLFSNHQCQQPPQAQASQQQQRTNHTSSSSTPYMSAEEFIMKTKNSTHDMNSNDLVNEFNLRMFINNGSEMGAANTGGVVSTSAHGHEFLNDQQMFGAAGNPTPNSSNNASQSPMMQMWMNSLAANSSNSIPSQQHSLLTNSPQTNSVSNQWLNGPLVGISSISLSNEQQGSPKPNTVSMWDVATLEQHVHVQQKQQQQQEQQLQQHMQQQTFEHQRQLKDNEKHLQDLSDQLQEINKQNNKQDESSQDLQHQQQKLSIHDGAAKLSSTNDSNNKQELQNQSQQSLANEKSHSNLNNNKRNSANNNMTSKPISKAKNENIAEQISKKSEEERRREQNEEKRRQKEERKRLQLEEEKRRLMQAEEEKRRQMQEEEKRQQQIQAQRRKALMSSVNNGNPSSNSSNANNCNNISPNSLTTAGNPKSKDQQRIQSSVAPWSTQTMTTKSQGPGLAEIQKAERRERRADQQRQLEIQEKHMRALAAAAEAQDTVLKWNAAPLPVKSFAEIQAEEAKRLAHEQMELQRRKEQEAHNNLVAFNSNSNSVAGGLNSSSNIASIWSGNKIWATTSNISGFWEDPLKFNGKSLSATTSNNNITNSNQNNSNLTAALIVSQSSSSNQHKSTNVHHQHTSAIQPSSNKNIKKSQSVSVMQNTSSTLGASTAAATSNQKKPPNNTSGTAKQSKSQKTENNTLGAVGGANNEKKTTVKNNNAVNKADDYEAEFTNWCTKSLNNMNTKVDVPTFVSFLRDLESPYEVKDYIRMYLGEGKEYIDFAKQFLERRSKYKNLQRAQNAHDDDLCKPAQAITPSVNDNGDNKGKQKKVKKSKMTKLDARILGFSVTAAEGRINVGDRDYGDAP